MARIAVSDQSFTLISAMDLAHPEDADRVLELAIGRTREHIRYLPGYRSASWLVRAPHGIGGDDDPRVARPGRRRIVEYIQWQSRDHFTAFAGDPDHSAHLREVARIEREHSFETYLVYRVVSARERAEAPIEPPAGAATLVILMDCQPGKQAWIADYNVYETESCFKHLDGFLAASFHVGHRGTSVAEYVLWESMEHFTAALAEPRFAEHSSVIRHYATSDFGVYEHVATVEPPSAT